jgi:hypothetical protein
VDEARFVSKTIVNIHEAKSHFSKLVARVEKGERIIVARAGKPVAKASFRILLGGMSLHGAGVAVARDPDLQLTPEAGHINF